MLRGKEGDKLFYCSFTAVLFCIAFEYLIRKFLENKKKETAVNNASSQPQQHSTLGEKFLLFEISIIIFPFQLPFSVMKQKTLVLVTFLDSPMVVLLKLIPPKRNPQKNVSVQFFDT